MIVLMQDLVVSYQSSKQPIVMNKAMSHFGKSVYPWLVLVIISHACTCSGEREETANSRSEPQQAVVHWLETALAKNAWSFEKDVIAADTGMAYRSLIILDFDARGIQTPPQRLSFYVYHNHSQSQAHESFAAEAAALAKKAAKCDSQGALEGRMRLGEVTVLLSGAPAAGPSLEAAWNLFKTTLRDQAKRTPDSEVRHFSACSVQID